MGLHGKIAATVHRHRRPAAVTFRTIRLEGDAAGLGRAHGDEKRNYYE